MKKRALLIFLFMIVFFVGYFVGTEREDINQTERIMENKNLARVLISISNDMQSINNEINQISALSQIKALNQLDFWETKAKRSEGVNKEIYYQLQLDFNHLENILQGKGNLNDKEIKNLIKVGKTLKVVADYIYKSEKDFEKISRPLWEIRNDIQKLYQLRVAFL